MKYISLCSGIEAASVGWEKLGWEPVAFAEVDEFPSAVLATRFPDVPNLGDLTKVDWKEFHGAVDLVVAGFPCQSYSISGLRKGLADPRGQIMLECLAAIRDIDPEWALLENVPGLLSSHGGGDFETLLNAVAILWPRGGVAWRILDSQWFGVAQRRRRVFAVINTRDWRRAAAVLLDENCLRGRTPTREEAREAAAGQASGGASEGGGDGCLTPWDVQSRRVFTEDAVWPSLYSGEGGGHGYVAKGEDDATCFKWFAGAKARTMPTYDDGSTPTLTNSDSHQPAVAFAQNQRDEVRLIGGDGSIAGTVQSQVWGTHKNETLIAEPIVMADTASHAELGVGGVAPTLKAHAAKEAPVLFDPIRGD